MMHSFENASCIVSQQDLFLTITTHFREQLTKTIEKNHWGYSIEEDAAAAEDDEYDREMTQMSNNHHTSPFPTPAPVIESTRLLHNKITDMCITADNIFQLCIGEYQHMLN